jgi:amino acid transporter
MSKLEKGQGPTGSGFGPAVSRTSNKEGAVLPAYDDGSSNIHGETRHQESWATRSGLNLRSFERRDNGIPENELERNMKPRHLQMIAIGGSIGAGFFVGSGGALATGGPGSLLIDFSIIGVMMFNVVYALGELSVLFPVSGGFYTYSTRFISGSWGMAMG